MENPFEFFGLEISLSVDPKLLRAKFIEIQMNAHPDLGNNENQSEKANAYFKALSNSETLVLAVIQANSTISISENRLPSDFLMEMMDLNDVISENPASAESILLKFEAALNDEFESLKSLDCKSLSEPQIQSLVIWYQKSKYLSRLRKNLLGIEEL